MCCNIKGCCGKGCGCTTSRIAKVLVIIGGLNWGLVGLGMLFGGPFSDWNIVHTIFTGAPLIEAIIYILVGLSAVIYIFGCKCKKCQAGSCNVEEKNIANNVENK